MIVLIASLLMTSTAHAQVQGISYPERFYPYQGWSATIRGDTNTVGMAGATVALPNNISAAFANPAGMAMTLPSVSLQLNSYRIQQPELNQSGEPLTETQWGGGASIPPWGYAISYYSTASEKAGSAEVGIRQFRFGVGRLIGSRLGLGANLEIHRAIRDFNNHSFSAGKITWRIGALYKLKHHWLLGLSFQPSLNIGPSDDPTTSFGFNQAIEEPRIIGLGIGFLPNRFFKAGFSLMVVGSTDNTALLADQTRAYGQNLTLQPRIGASYVLAEYSWMRVEFAMGSYYEVSRIEYQPNRLHATFGFELNPWFINTGIGTDVASHYGNFSASIGIDMVRTARFFGIIPKDPVPPINDTFPPAVKIINDGLPVGFIVGEKQQYAPVSVKEVSQIVEDIPTKVKQKFSSEKKRPSVKKVRPRTRPKSTQP